MQEYREEVKKAIKYAVDKGVGVVAMKTQGGKRLQQEGKVEINHEAALKWVLADENVCTTIPGMTTFDQLEQNFKAMSNLMLSHAEKKELLLAHRLKGILYCQNCRYCINTCPGRVEIPTLMRSYMYMEGYGNLIQARITTAGLSKNHSLNVCQECSSCTAVCRNGIHINSRLRSLIAERLHLG